MFTEAGRITTPSEDNVATISPMSIKLAKNLLDKAEVAYTQDKPGVALSCVDGAIRNLLTSLVTIAGDVEGKARRENK